MSSDCLPPKGCWGFSVTWTQGAVSTGIRGAPPAGCCHQCPWVGSGGHGEDGEALSVPGVSRRLFELLRAPCLLPRVGGDWSPKTGLFLEECGFGDKEGDGTVDEIGVSGTGWGWAVCVCARVRVPSICPPLLCPYLSELHVSLTIASFLPLAVKVNFDFVKPYLGRLFGLLIGKLSSDPALGTRKQGA